MTTLLILLSLSAVDIAETLAVSRDSAIVTMLTFGEITIPLSADPAAGYEFVVQFDTIIVKRRTPPQPSPTRGEIIWDWIRRNVDEVYIPLWYDAIRQAREQSIRDWIWRNVDRAYIPVFLDSLIRRETRKE